MAARRLRIVIASLLALIMAACGGGGGATSQPGGEEDTEATTPAGNDGTTAADGEVAGTITIGLEGEITGAVAALTARGLNAAKLAIDQVNGEGGIEVAGERYMLDWVEGDGKYDVAETVSVMRRLSQVDEVSAIVGSYTSLTAVGAMEVAEELETPFVITGATTSEIPKKIVDENYEYVFMSSPTAPERASADATAVEELVDPQKVFIIAQDSGWGIDVSETVMDHFSDVDVQREVVDPGHTDYGATVAQISAMQPDIVFAVIGGAELFSFIEQLRAAGEDMLVYGTSSDPASSVFIDEMGPLAEGVLGNLVWVPTEGNELIERFAREYEDTYGSVPADVEAQTYDGMLMLFDALRQAESPSREHIAAALQNASIDGVRGPQEYDSEDHTTKDLPFVVGQIQDGEHEIVWPEDQATADLVQP